MGPIAGYYAYHAKGVRDPLLPDLVPDAADSERIPFSEGSLTDGDASTCVGWRAATVGETGVDLLIDLRGPHFIDRVVVHQPGPGGPASATPDAAPPSTDNIEAVGHVEPSGLSCLEVYASRQDGDGPVLAGRSGEPGPDVVPAGPVQISVGAEASELCVRLISYQRDILVSDLQIWGSELGQPTVFPVPARMQSLPGEPFSVSEGVTVLTGASASADTHFAAALLAEELREELGQAVEVVQDGGPEPVAATITIGMPGECDRLAATALPGPDVPESYTLKAEGAGAWVLAADRRGLIYGVETLLQLIRDAEPAVPPCLVQDRPRLAFRGVHLFLPARSQIGYTKRLIRHLLVPMKMNTIFLELAGAMRFDRRPEIAEAWEKSNRLAAEGQGPPVPHGSVCGGGCLTKAEVKDLVDYARSHGIEVIPEIQSLSHVQYLTMTYPEIAEKPVEDGYPDAYCPQHPESLRIVYDMIDEVADLLGPLRYIHMGHDEVYTMAECPRCRGKSRDELFAAEVTAIHDYLAQKGIGMMVWADMLQPWQYYSGENAATMVPKDIVMLEFVWYFRTWADTEDILLDNGFKVIFGNCYSSHFTRYERRTSKDGVIGAQVSVWAGTNEEDMGRLGKLYDLVYSANAAWSASCQAELRWTVDRMIADLMPGIRSRLRGSNALPEGRVGPSRPLDLEAGLTAPLRDPAGRCGGYDLTSLPSGEVTWRGVPFRVGEGVVLVQNDTIRKRIAPARVSLPLASRARVLVFAHTCSAMGPILRSLGDRQPLGRYGVRYTDGSTETLDVAYGHHVAEWNRRHGEPLGPTFHRHAGYVATYPADCLWQGKAATGEDVTLYGMEWTNPYPDRVIQEIEVSAADSGTDASLILVAVTAVE